MNIAMSFEIAIPALWQLCALSCANTSCLHTYRLVTFETLIHVKVAYQHKNYLCDIIFLADAMVLLLLLLVSPVA